MIGVLLGYVSAMCWMLEIHQKGSRFARVLGICCAIFICVPDSIEIRSKEAADSDNAYRLILDLYDRHYEK